MKLSPQSRMSIAINSKSFFSFPFVIPPSGSFPFLNHHWSAFCYNLYFIELYAFFLFHPILLWYSSILLHVPMVHFFLLLISILFYEYISFLNPFTSRWIFALFLFLAVMNNAMNIFIQVVVWTYVFMPLNVTLITWNWS